MSLKKYFVLNANGQFELLQAGDVVASPIYNFANTDVTKTGNVTETVMANLKVTGGDMGLNGIIASRAKLFKIGVAGVATWKYYVSTVATNVVGNTGVPASSTLIGTYGALAANLTAGIYERELANKNNAALNNAFPTAFSIVTDINAAASARTAVNVNTANDFYIVLTVTLANAADTAILDNIQLFLRK